MRRSWRHPLNSIQNLAQKFEIFSEGDAKCSPKAQV